MFLFCFLRDWIGLDRIGSDRPVCMAGFGRDLFIALLHFCMNRIKRLGMKENEI